MRRLQPFLTTTSPREAGSPTGGQLSEPGAVTRSSLPPEVPAKLALECVTTRLPQSVQWWLDAMERHSRVVASVGGNPPKVPTLTAEEASSLASELAVLNLILQPAQAKGGELVAEVASFLAIWPFGLRHDGSLMQAKVDQWCTELERYPLYAIRRALGWWRRNGTKEPSLSEVLSDVRLFVGSGVMERQRMLEAMGRAA